MMLRLWIQEVPYFFEYPEYKIRAQVHSPFILGAGWAKMCLAKSGSEHRILYAICIPFRVLLIESIDIYLLRWCDLARSLKFGKGLNPDPPMQPIDSVLDGDIAV